MKFQKITNAFHHRAIVCICYQKKDFLHFLEKKNFMYLLKRFDESSHMKKSDQYKNQYVFNKNSTCSDFVYFKLIRNKQIIKI